jgi:xanthine/CO dehydrogenase XdhC/CoxF family maturation factor
MKELNDIIHAYDKAVLQNKQTALATVVKVEGSSYRRPGARMLVTEDGDITGAISGGCLEGDALRKAQLAMFEKKNKLEIYDTSDEEDHKFGVQLGCNGIVYILFEPIKQDDENNPIYLLKRVAAQRKDAEIITAFNQDMRRKQTGTCCIINSDDAVWLIDDASIKKDYKAFFEQKNSIIKDYEEQSVLYQFVPPPIQLIIVGAGNDAQPLVDMASLLGWHIIVADGRPTYATPQRFPKANRICIVKPVDVLSAVQTDEQTAVVLMTHNYNYDIAALEQFINTNCKYIGVLGPKKKLNKMFDELNEKGIAVDDKKQNIYGPVGLDLGAETSEEIALSIIAEIKAIFSKRQGSSLKEKTIEIRT